MDKYRVGDRFIVRIDEVLHEKTGMVTLRII